MPCIIIDSDNIVTISACSACQEKKRTHSKKMKKGQGDDQTAKQATHTCSPVRTFSLCLCTGCSYDAMPRMLVYRGKQILGGVIREVTGRSTGPMFDR